MRHKLENAVKVLAVILMVIGVVWILWDLIDNTLPWREPTFAATYQYTDWSDAKAVILADLYEGDLVVYRIGYESGLLVAWIENAKGEKKTRVATSGKTALVIPERGDYMLRMVGDHASASVELSIYVVE